MQKIDWKRPQPGHYLGFINGKLVGVITNAGDPNAADPRYRKSTCLMSYVDEIGGSWTETHPTLLQSVRALRSHLFGAR